MTDSADPTSPEPGNQPVGVPSGPQAGWYPDPVTGTGHRYWNGFAWTEDYNLDPDGSGGGVQPAGAWFGETFSLVIGQVVRLFALILVLSVPIGLASGLLTYEVLDGGRLLFEYGPDDEITSIEAEGFGGPVIPAVILFLLGLVASFVLAGAVSRMSVFARTGRPEPWSASLVGGLKRSPAVIGVSLFIGVTVLLVLMVTALLLPVALVTVPLLVYFVVRLSLATTSAAVAPKGVSGISNSLTLTEGFGWAIFGRLLLLLLVIFAGQILVGLLSAPLASGGQPFQIGDPELRMTDVLGDNRYVFGFQQVVGSIVSGFASAMYGAGMAVIYLDRGGQLDEDFAMEDPF